MPPVFTLGGSPNQAPPNPNIEPIDPRTGLQAPLLPGGTTSATGGAAVATGPTAAQIAKANADAAARAGLAQRQTGIQAAGDVSARDTGNTFENNNRNFLTTYDTGVNTINNDRATNALNLRRSMAAIANGVRTGLRSGGVSLANMNALDSGAAEALARAWATMGNGQAGDANNQAAVKGMEIDTNLANLNRTRDDTIAGFNQYRDTETGRLGADLGTKLGGLGAEGAGVGFGADMGIRDRIVAGLVARLNQIDADRNARLASIHAIDPNEAAAKAVEMDTAGVAGSSPFAIDAVQTSAPAGVGADISQLPLFTRRRTA
jgi:hypothetical protein